MGSFGGRQTFESLTLFLVPENRGTLAIERDNVGALLGIPLTAQAYTNNPQNGRASCYPLWIPPEQQTTCSVMTVNRPTPAATASSALVRTAAGPESHDQPGKA